MKSQAWFQTKIARPEVQLPLYKIQFEIAEFNSQICQTMAVFVFHFPAMWLFSLKKALKSDWLICFTVAFSLAEKKDAI